MAKNPINRESLKKLLDTVTPMNPETAERFVREVLRIGDERRRDAERLLNEVTAAGRKSAEHFSAAVQQEVAKQLGRVVLRIDSLERQIEHLNRNVDATRTVVASAASKAVARAKKGSAPSSAATTGSSGTSKSDKAGGKKKSAVKSSGNSSKKTSSKAAESKKSGSKKSGAKKSGTKKSGTQKSGTKNDTSMNADTGISAETSSTS